MPSTNHCSGVWYHQSSTEVVIWHATLLTPHHLVLKFDPCFACLLFSGLNEICNTGVDQDMKVGICTRSLTESTVGVAFVLLLLWRHYQGFIKIREISLSLHLGHIMHFCLDATSYFEHKSCSLRPCWYSAEHSRLPALCTSGIHTHMQNKLSYSATATSHCLVLAKSTIIIMKTHWRLLISTDTWTWCCVTPCIRIWPDL